MTKEEVIDVIKCLAWHTRPDEEQIEQAIKVLEQQPCEDCVSRKAVLDTLMKYEKPCDDRQDFYLDSTTEFEEEIKELPPVTPTFPEGATNGDMIKAMFPNTESRLDEKTGIILVKWADGTTKTFKASWWNAPYKGVENG